MERKEIIVNGKVWEIISSWHDYNQVEHMVIKRVYVEEDACGSDVT